jgi:hypothetical protein
MRSFRAIAVLLACAVPFFALAEEKLGKIDRMRLVGTPVLTQAARGVHVWLEDGWYRVAAVSALPVGGAKKRQRDFTVTIRSTKSITEAELFQWKKSGGDDDSLVLRVKTGPDPEIMRFKTEGDLMISHATVEGEPAQIFLGPLAKPGASLVRVGRY